MSSRKVKGLWVSLEQDITEEGAELMANAIRMFRYVAGVEFEDLVVEHDDWMERERLRSDISDVTTTVLRALLAGNRGFYLPERTRDKTISELEKIITRLREKQ